MKPKQNSKTKQNKTVKQTRTVTKQQLTKMVNESVKRKLAKTQTITLSQLDEQVREIVKRKLDEMRAPAVVPSVDTISESLGFQEPSKTTATFPGFNKKEQVVVEYAMKLNGIDSKELEQDVLVASLKNMKPVSTLTEAEFSKVKTCLNEWSSKYDEPIVEAGKALVSKLED